MRGRFIQYQLFARALRQLKTIFRLLHEQIVIALRCVKDRGVSSPVACGDRLQMVKLRPPVVKEILLLTPVI